MGRILLLIGTFWLVVAFWQEHVGESQWLWMAVLPVAWLATLSLLSDQR